MFKENEYHIDLDEYPADFSPAHCRILSARNIGREDLNKSLKNLIHFNELYGIKLAAELLRESIIKNDKIVIVGDYDADGATATALLLRLLKHLKANVAYFIPDRITMGYGLSSFALQHVLALKPDLVITVDNGINSIEQVAILKQQNIKVIITDHHLPQNLLPNADVIVNPNQPNCNFASKNLAGVGVAFYLAMALRNEYREKSANNVKTELEKPELEKPELEKPELEKPELEKPELEKPELEKPELEKPKNLANLENFNLSSLLDLVAIGTIADCVELDKNNRILIEQGLRRIRNNKASIGISALIKTSMDSPLEQLNSIDMAFKIVPRINAAGRVADISLGVDCLMAEDDRIAMDYAMELSNLNRERRAIENEMRSQAREHIANLHIEANTGICLFDEKWHEGVIGILASRIKEKYNLPALVFTNSGKLLKASGRSINGINLVKVLNSIEKKHPTLIATYGGHAKAAGLALYPDNYAEFKQLFEQETQKILNNLTIDSNIYTDGSLLPHEMTIENAIFLKTFEVWGQGIAEPVFNNVFYIDSVRYVKDSHTKFKLIDINTNKVFNGVSFENNPDYQYLTTGLYQIAYRLNVNEWQGQSNLSLLVIKLGAVKN